MMAFRKPRSQPAHHHPLARIITTLIMPTMVMAALTDCKETTEFTFPSKRVASDESKVVAVDWSNLMSLDLAIVSNTSGKSRANQLFLSVYLQAICFNEPFHRPRVRVAVARSASLSENFSNPPIALLLPNSAAALNRSAGIRQTPSMPVVVESHQAGRPPDDWRSWLTPRPPRRQ